MSHGARMQLKSDNRNEMLFFLFLKKKIFKELCIYFRKKEREQGRGKESQADALLSMEPDAGLHLRAIRLWPELK